MTLFHPFQRRNVYLGILVFLLLAVGRTSQAQQYRFDHWTADNGLPQNSVRDIVQTRDGYLWLATYDGLVRFDGVRFTVFNKSNTPGIVSNRFIRLVEDAQGDLWANTEDHEMTRLHDGRFTSYTKEQGLPDNESVNIGGDGRGNLLLCGNGRMWRWANAQFQPVADYQIPAATDAAPNKTAPLLFCTVGGQRGMGFPPGYVLPWKPVDFLWDVGLRDRQGQIWMATLKGLYRFADGIMKPSEMPEQHLTGRPSVLVHGLATPQVLTIANDESVWLTELDTQRSHLVTPRLPERSNGVAGGGTEVFSAYGDREGNLWIGTLYSGLYRARPQSLITYGKAHGLTSTEVYPVIEDRDGAIWAGVQGAGVFRWQNGGFTHFDGRDAFGDSVSSLYRDRAGQLWVNVRWRSEPGRFVRVINENVAPPDGKGAAWAMHEDRNGVFWFGRVTGVDRLQNGVVTHFTTKDGLAGDDTKVIIDDGADGLWIGSYGGLTHYRNGQFQRWTDKDGLPGNTVRALHLDRDGALWIGTYDSGLGRFKDGKFTRYTARDGLFDNGVFQFLEDDYGWCWMSCNRGIYRVRKQELLDFADGKTKTITSIAYGKGDGMENVECNGGRWPAGVKSHDGKLWFPTMGGLVMIDPANVKANTQPPPVVIEQMKINNEPVASDAWESAIRHPNSAIQVKPGLENFEIEYTALSFINSPNLRFKYKLEGADADWVDAGTRRTAYFSHLAPGTYTFKVIAANSDGIWNQEGQQLRITVLPPFYRTWWFLTLTTLAIGGLAYSAYAYRIGQLERRHALQQAFSDQLIASQEAERARIAAGLHDSLGQQLLVIKNWAMIGLNLTPREATAREPLDEISTSASQAIEEVREVIYDLRPYQLDKIGLTNTLRFMIEKMATASNLEVQTELDDIDNVFPHDKQVTLYRIVQECLTNIVKHAQATQARITIRRHTHTLQMVIEDNGRGFAIAERGMQSAELNTKTNPTSAIQPPQSSGLGLTSLRERVRMLGGRESISSATGQGTRIQITIDLSS